MGGIGTLSPNAQGLYRALVRESAKAFGGGYVGAGSSLLLRWVATKAELAEEARAKGDTETFRKLSESARMDLLYAREHAMKEAVARHALMTPSDPFALAAEGTVGTLENPALTPTGRKRGRPLKKDRCSGVPGQPSWGNCARRKGHEGACTYDPKDSKGPQNTEAETQGTEFAAPVPSPIDPIPDEGTEETS